jgi:RND family efflux transporter MFP subunit
MSNPKKTINMTQLWQSTQVWVIAVLGTVGVGLLLMFLAGVFDRKVAESGTTPSNPVPEGATVVEVRRITRPRYESAVGTIEAIHRSSVAAKILAKVIEVNVNAGQQVEAGQVLVRLSDEDLQSKLKQAEAAHDFALANAQQARSDFERASQLIQGNAISRAEYESAGTAVQATEAEVDRTAQAIDETKVILDYATIKAPFDGIVVDKQVQAGDTVTPGQTLLVLYDPTEMQLVANVRESLAMKLKVGQEVPAKLESFDYECLATVREVVPQAEVGSRSFQVKVTGPCPPGVYSGMFGRIKLPLEDEELIVIPAAAVRRVGQLTLVNVVEAGQMIRRNVQIGRQLGKDVEILSGLQAGEKVVVEAGC